MNNRNKDMYLPDWLLAFGVFLIAGGGLLCGHGISYFLRHRFPRSKPRPFWTWCLRYSVLAESGHYDAQRQRVCLFHDVWQEDGIPVFAYHISAAESGFHDAVCGR